MPHNLLRELQAEVEARRKSEDALRALTARQEVILSAIPDIIMEVDCLKVYRWANQAGLDFFGDDVIGKDASFYFEGDQETYQEVEPLFGGSDRVIAVESWQRRKDGVKRLLAWRCRALKDGRGVVVGALSLAHDITERKRAECEISSQLEELRRWQAVILGREGRIAELKREVNVLCARLNLPPPYASQEGPDRKQER